MSNEIDSYDPKAKDNFPTREQEIIYDHFGVPEEKRIYRMRITNHHELRRRVAIDCSSPQLTDQSFKQSCDINNIMAQYAKTGMFPHLNKNEPHYIDNTTIPNLEEAFAISRNAIDAFNSLPATIRKLMDNDPSKLELFISDPENADILLKHGILNKKPEPIEVGTNSLSDPPSADKDS